MKDSVKMFFEELSLQKRKKFLQNSIKHTQNIQNGYMKGAIGYNACQEKIEEKRKELRTLE